MGKLGSLISLMRPYQWYKNLVIFLPILFGGQLFNIIELSRAILGLISICLISSVNYIINDIADRKRDRSHPEKKNRPLAANEVTVVEAVILAVFLLVLSVVVAVWLDKYFLYIILAIFALTQCYTFYFKKEIFLDIILISINFVLRAAAGAFLVKPYILISPWLILCSFFLSLFISIGKRESDIIFLGKKSQSHKEVLQDYKNTYTQSLMIITTTSLIVSYSLYSFLSVYKNLLLTLPVAMYAIFRYLSLIYQGKDIARHPELIFSDTRILISLSVWLLAVIMIIYSS
jgi:4-hydroxybenzoate polyprenyltransferase